MKKFILAVLLSLVSTFALAQEVLTIPFKPGSGQVVVRSGPVKAGGYVDCKFTTTADMNADLVKNGNLFVVQPLGDGTMIGTFQGKVRMDTQDFSYQFSQFQLKPATDYTVHVEIAKDGNDSPGIRCKLNAGPKPRTGRK